MYFLIQALGFTPNNTAVSVAVIHNNPFSFLIDLNAESIYTFGVPKGSIEITLGHSIFFSPIKLDFVNIVDKYFFKIIGSF
jgi:hypothetical protein